MAGSVSRSDRLRGVRRSDSKQGSDSADGYEYWLEILGSIVLIGVGLLFWKQVGGRLGKAVGANVFSAGCVAFVVFLAYGLVFRRRSQRRTAQQEQRLDDILDKCEELETQVKLEQRSVLDTVDERLAASLSEFRTARKVGLTGYEIGRPVHEINEAVLQAKQTVDILEVSLKTMQSIETTEWRQCKANVRIMLLDPLFPARWPVALQRDGEERQGEGQILAEIHDILGRFPREWFQLKGGGLGDGTFEHALGAARRQEETGVKLARVMPTMSYFRIDDVAYFAPLVHRQLGDVTMHLRLAAGGKFFEALHTHFETLWRDEERTVTVQPGDIPSVYPAAKIV